MPDPEKDDALFSGRGMLSEDLARLEASLSRLPVPPEPDWGRIQPQRRGVPVLVYAAAAALAIVALAGLGLARDAWRVETLAGAPALRGLAFAGRVALGGVIATDERSRARLEVKGLGEVELEPGSVLRRVRGRGGERRLALERGRIRANVIARPREFVVETRSGVATDLGCAYTLNVEPDGHGRLEVTSGRVTLTHAALESFVPAGAWCPLLPGGPGVPRSAYASDAFLAALAAYDLPERPAAAVDMVLATAEGSDALTLWHLLPRVGGDDRARVAERIAELIEVPADVPRERVLALEPAALDAWWGAIGMGEASEWRAGPFRKALRW
jgi:hypothetical protein